MANLKISEFADGGAVQATDQIATNRGGVNTRVTVGTMAAEDAADYQPLLVSATNIKTINGTSVLGSGDITVTGTGMVVGNSITSATAGSILFAGTSGVLAQDNANFFRSTSTGNIGIGTNTPNAAAAIDVVSTTKGIKLPVMTQAQRDAISSPPEGLMVYDSDFGGLWVRGKFSTWNNYKVTFNLANAITPASLELAEATANGVHKVSLTVPSSMSSDYVVTCQERSGVMSLEQISFTVGGLPSASPAYQRAFVSDANATTFNSIVAGGGSNKVPVFSDGTNWRIG